MNSPPNAFFPIWICIICLLEKSSSFCHLQVLSIFCSYFCKISGSFTCSVSFLIMFWWDMSFRFTDLKRPRILDMWFQQRLYLIFWPTMRGMGNTPVRCLSFLHYIFMSILALNCVCVNWLLTSSGVLAYIKGKAPLKGFFILLWSIPKINLFVVKFCIQIIVIVHLILINFKDKPLCYRILHINHCHCCY